MENLSFKVVMQGTPLVVQWLRLRASNAGGAGSVPGQGTPRGQKIKIK